MPRTGERRPLVALKLGTAETAHIDQRARDEKLLKGDGEPNRSEMMRLMLAYAAANMPPGWRPES
jgi:hypothetical protein